MKNRIKILAVVIIFGAIGAYVGYTFVYNKAHTDFEKANADFSLTARQLFDNFRNNTETAGEKYIGKVIEISGTLSNVEEADSLIIAVFAFGEGMFGAEGVRVTMLPNHAETLKKHPLTSALKLKGFCPGYNGTDVIIESGSLVK